MSDDTNDKAHANAGRNPRLELMNDLLKNSANTSIYQSLSKRAIKLSKKSYDLTELLEAEARSKAEFSPKSPIECRAPPECLVYSGKESSCTFSDESISDKSQNEDERYTISEHSENEEQELDVEKMPSDF